MTDTPPPPRRRQAFGYLASLPILGWAGAAWPARLRAPERHSAERVAPQRAPMPDGATMLVAGPRGCELDQWASALAPTLARSLPPGATVRAASSGGVDGVTGANQFAARVAPDGTTLLLAPGAAALAWLAGDPRTHFDVARWVPVMTGMTSGLVAGTLPPDRLVPGGTARVATSGPVGPDMPALLALEILGVEPVPVFTPADPAAIRAAFARGDIDLAFLRGEQIVSGLAGSGVRPLFSLGVPAADGTFARDPGFADLRQMTEVYASLHRREPAGRLFQAWTAAAVAARLEFCLVLPELTPAALIALWRQAGVQAIRAPELQQTAAATLVRPLTGSGAAATTTALAPDAASLLELRRWLGTRLDWHPGADIVRLTNP